MQGTAHPNRPKVGRAAPRSRRGCITCKQRHVRCDEAHPVCGHCDRLQLSCGYQKKAVRGPQSRQRADPVSSQNHPSTRDTEPNRITQLPTPLSFHETSRYSQGSLQNAASPDWWLDASWAGEACLIPSPDSGSRSTTTAIFDEALIPSHAPVAIEFTHAGGQFITDEFEHRRNLFRLFERIVQPPASILLGGQRRWRRLQRYLVGMSHTSHTVVHALLCVIELLMIDEVALWPNQTREHCTTRILEHHQLACSGIQTAMTAFSLSTELGQLDELLAAIVLLAWFEVIQDHDGHTVGFPQQAASAIVTTQGYSWNNYSRHLLSWLKTLDTKATHMGGGTHLLSPEALHIVSAYPTQLVTSSKEAADDQDGNLELATLNSSGTNAAGLASGTQQRQMETPSVPIGHAKLILLQAIFQPTLEWYSATQLCCRKIGSQDKHHRARFTPEDEFEVIIKCKDLEAELWQLWEQRPEVMSLPLSQLMTLLPPDMANRMQDVFSLFLASFWILFVYLHRVCWWNLAHSATVRTALEEVWKHLQSAYGEWRTGDENGKKKVVHPALLWPVFLFGAECVQEERQDWAVDQLQALAQTRPVLQLHDDEDEEILPPFRMGFGAIKNAKRAAVLLRELVGQQAKSGARVDDRDLSMKLFGCYFSFV
ncbi:hypothetical protein BJY00DRAFT_314597 [Aspergillus carlsbadensis]|nr:hypothetical protein BJY00DRAFT_314597 [Aspergillus carlsbadensis]